jgi:hypothetical protein
LPPPPCRRQGRHCRTLDVTIRVTTIDGEEDHDATWLLGHTERIDFGPLFERDGELWCDASIHVPCRFLATGDDGQTLRCTAHGFESQLRAVARVPAPRRLGSDQFAVVEQQRLVGRRLAAPPVPQRSLPLAPSANPCATAACRTSDNKRGAACCRDVQVDICCTTKQTLLEALIRNREAPYLCKAQRENDEQLVVEIISACGFLKGDGACDLHGRTRADGRPAKPLMCSQWPEKRSGLHTGCAYRNRRLKL